MGKGMSRHARTTCFTATRHDLLTMKHDPLTQVSIGAFVADERNVVGVMRETATTAAVGQVLESAEDPMDIVLMQMHTFLI